MIFIFILYIRACPICYYYKQYLYFKRINIKIIKISVTISDVASIH